MTITLTSPIVRPSIALVSLVDFQANVKLRHAELTFELGYNDGGLVPVQTRKITFDDNPAVGADFTFAQLINNVPEAAALKSALETAVVQFGVFQGTVS